MSEQTQGAMSPGRIETTRATPSVEKIGLIGEHDLATAPEVRRAFDSALQRSRAVVVDLSAATFIDSSIVSLLVEFGRPDGTVEPRFVLFAPPSLGLSVRRVLDLTGITEHIRTSDSLEGAVESASGGS